MNFFHLVPLLAGAALAFAADQPAFDTMVSSNAMVPMRDGVKLSTDVYRPAREGVVAEGKFPVLLCRTPYDKRGWAKGSGWLAQHGFVVLIQDVRGRFASEGEFYPFTNEGPDGYDTIEWAAAQPWSDGQVGTFGASYLAWDQYHAAMYKPPHLVAMFAVVGGANFYQEYAHPGGTLNLGWPLWLLSSAASSPRALKQPGMAAPLHEIFRNPAKWLALPPAQRGDTFQAFPEQHKAYDDLYAHADFDSYWKQKGWYTAGYYNLIKDVPIFFLTGWYDYFADGVLENFTALSRSQRSMKKLMVGPWPHSVGDSTCGDASFGTSAHISDTALIVDWFNHWMKHREFAVVAPDPVRVFQMGGGDGSRDSAGKLNHGGEWVSASAWPPAGTAATKYYLHPAGVLNTQAPAREEVSTFAFDPAHPVPTIGGRYWVDAMGPGCAQNQQSLNQRPDVLSYSTAPLESPRTITGAVRAVLWASSDAADTDFTAKLVDVYPDGYSLILADGQLRARYRNSFEKPEPLRPGEVYRLVVELGSTSNLFAKGHRIRLDVSSSNYPKFEPNPLKARNSVYHQPGRSSYVELPVTSDR